MIRVNGDGDTAFGVAIRLRLLDDQAPLTEDTIEATRQAVLSQLTKQLGARLRS